MDQANIPQLDSTILTLLQNMYAKFNAISVVQLGSEVSSHFPWCVHQGCSKAPPHVWFRSLSQTTGY